MKAIRFRMTCTAGKACFSAWLPLILIFIIVVSLVSCAGNDDPVMTDVTLKLLSPHGSEYIGYYVAEKLGYYEEANLNVSFVPGTGITEAAVTLHDMEDGNYDYVLGMLPPSMDWEDFPDTVFLGAIYQASPATFFARASSGLQNPYDFPGHRIDITADCWRSAVAVLTAALGIDSAGISVARWEGETTPIYSENADIMTGFLTWDVVLASYEGYDIISWPLFEYGLTTCDNFIAAAASRLEEDAAFADRSTRFLAASYKGWDWALSNPERAMDIMMDMFPEMRSQRAYHALAFETSIPLIQYAHQSIGSLENIGGLTGVSPYPARLYDHDYAAVTATGEAP